MRRRRRECATAATRNALNSRCAAGSHVAGQLRRAPSTVAAIGSDAPRRRLLVQVAHLQQRVLDDAEALLLLCCVVMPAPARTQRVPLQRVTVLTARRN